MNIEKFMSFENPTKDLTGSFLAVQGFAIHNDIGFVSFHTGYCAAYDLISRDPKPLGVFKLGSYNAGDPDKRYTNHANQGMFSKKFLTEESKFPLLYVTAGNSGDTDELGYIGRCAVENITEKDGVFSSECVQTIVYNNDGIEKTQWETPGWGWFAHFVDSENGYYYTFSSRYRTKITFIDKYDQNNYIVTKFKLPEIGEIGETLVLHPTDILDQILFPFNVLFTQGGVLYDDKIYYTFGAGTETYPIAIRVFDLKQRKLIHEIDLSDSIFATEEIECIDHYNGRFLVNTNRCRLYSIEI